MLFADAMRNSTDNAFHIGDLGIDTGQYQHGEVSEQKLFIIKE